MPNSKLLPLVPRSSLSGRSPVGSKSGCPSRISAHRSSATRKASCLESRVRLTSPRPTWEKWVSSGKNGQLLVLTRDRYWMCPFWRYPCLWAWFEGNQKKAASLGIPCFQGILVSLVASPFGLWIPFGVKFRTCLVFMSILVLGVLSFCFLACWLRLLQYGHVRFWGCFVHQKKQSVLQPSVR